MENYKPTVGVEPTNKYEKARQDILKAKMSFDELNEKEKEQLVKELLGITTVEQILRMIKRG